MIALHDWPTPNGWKISIAPEAMKPADGARTGQQA
jgi:hypothetical protein